MNINFLNKKIPFKIVIIALLIIAGGIGVIFYWQKTHIPPVSPISPDISSEAVKAKCLEEVSEMDEKQLIEEINTLPFATGEDLRKLNSLMSDYLICQFLRNPFGEQYAKTKSLYEILKFSEESRSRNLEKLDLSLSISLENFEGVKRRISHPSVKIVVYDKEMLCPDGKENSKIIEELAKKAAESGHSRERAENVMGDYCEQIDKYSADEDSLINEIYQFKDWSEDLNERLLEYRWKAILAFRFGGETKAKQVCDNLFNEEEKEDCQERVRSIGGWPTSVIPEECTRTELGEIMDLICEL